MLGLYIGLGVLAVLLFFVIFAYNKISKNKLRVDNAFSQIRIQRKKQAALAPYLADVVKKYAEFGKDTLIGAERAATKSNIPKNLAGEDFYTSSDIKRLFMQASGNPNIKADANFLQLQNELTNLEKAIAVSRGFYNDAVMIYNRSVHTFPVNIVAKIFKFKPAEFLEPSDEETIIKGQKCPSCGAVSDSAICLHCGTRIPLI